MGDPPHFEVLVQGPPYILARYETAIFSIRTANFQKNFVTEQGHGSSQGFLKDG